MTDDRPPSSTLKTDVPDSSNATIADSDASEGLVGFALKSVGTLTFCVERAYSASLAAKLPSSMVSVASDSTMMFEEEPAAPSTASSSYTLPPSITSPSTS